MPFQEILANLSTISIILFIVGLILIIVEMFQPGFGAAGISGIILLLTGILITAKSVLEGIIMALVILLILGILLTIVFYSANKGRLSRTLILRAATDRESGFSGTEDLKYLLGKTGVAYTPLRPAGSAEIEGVRLDVVTEGEYIEKGTAIAVTKVEGNRIVVIADSSPKKEATE